MKRMIILSLFSLMLCSCTENVIQEILFKPNRDPLFESPKVDSFSDSKCIKINWNSDTGTDCYYLMKREDTSAGDFKCIYKGKILSYEDYDIENEKRYIYRIDKKRGNKTFISDKYGYGFAADCIKDRWEPNDDMNTATLLEADLNCNLFFAFFKTDDNEIHDIDWFYIVIPPGRTACLVVTDESLTDTTAGASSDLCIQINEHQSMEIENKKEYTVTNTSTETLKIYFSIFPNISKLKKSDGSSIVINYSVSLTKITK